MHPCHSRAGTFLYILLPRSLNCSAHDNDSGECEPSSCGSIPCNKISCLIIKASHFFSTCCNSTCSSCGSVVQVCTCNLEVYIVMVGLVCVFWFVVSALDGMRLCLWVGIESWKFERDINRYEGPYFFGGFRVHFWTGRFLFPFK
jgi:hypothetical protein